MSNWYPGRSPSWPSGGQGQWAQWPTTSLGSQNWAPRNNQSSWGYDPRWSGFAHAQRPAGAPQDPVEFARGIRKPWGQFFGPSQIASAIAASNPKITVGDTPFSGSRVFAPITGGPHPALIVLHGSDGGASGWNEMEAVKWAQRGYAVMSYAYFGAEGTPPGLGGVELDTVFDAARWLKQSRWAKDQKVGLYGVSRGAEMTMMLASLAPDDLISAAVAHSPQDKSMGSFTVTREGHFDHVRNALGHRLPAWKKAGLPIPDATSTAIENFDGGLFITHGTADEVWSVDGTRALEQRLKAAGKEADVRYLEGEKHATSPALNAKLDDARDAFLKKLLRSDC